MTQQTNPLACECINWARTGDEAVLFIGHHPRCPQAAMVRDVRALLDRLIEGIEHWAGDEDGVHPDCWDAYRDACVATGRLCTFMEAD